MFAARSRIYEYKYEYACSSKSCSGAFSDVRNVDIIVSGPQQCVAVLLKYLVRNIPAI